ncbi:hypothetical protein CRG98_013425 [Punica granatum]|uniref:Uncharacterized protein n=1 Tax=Punica granatum TaxID=22663 RepID=A0A2I0KCC6_PUNGR|nr:hypothetical protein CRG98_013425 [Punica granatum]
MHILTIREDLIGRISLWGYWCWYTFCLPAMCLRFLERPGSDNASNLSAWKLFYMPAFSR